MVIGDVVARRGRRLVGQVADGGDIAVGRRRRAGQQPSSGGGVRWAACRQRRGGAGDGDVELLLAVRNFVVVSRHAAGVRAHHLVDLARGERVAGRGIGELDRHYQHIVSSGGRGGSGGGGAVRRGSQQ